jgi:hypothetical protein
MANCNSNPRSRQALYLCSLPAEETYLGTCTVYTLWWCSGKEQVHTSQMPTRSTYDDEACVLVSGGQR